MKYYDEGWNDYIDGKPYVSKATIDWRDGWKDAKEYHETEKVMPAKMD